MMTKLNIRGDKQEIVETFDSEKERTLPTT